ncbi:helix-turn-helix domain-containing protein [Sulfitobacter aestuarii]|uniref:Helix-turn-helix domain-containing protein n=1 Tax=Sulfitobacter aestuarii TaxID=2161676 RepID=A0ABW5U0Y9_9RHOB
MAPAIENRIYDWARLAQHTLYCKALLNNLAENSMTIEDSTDSNQVVHTESIQQLAASLIAAPTDHLKAEKFLNSLQDAKGIFRAQEDDIFDFKREFPHSFTDSYFAAICRLIFGFHNTFGGIVVLGVDDEKRTAGHNKKIVNIERLNTRLRELSGQSINVRHLHLEDEDEERDDSTSVDLLVVPKRPTSQPPIVLLSKIDKYPEGTLWLRRGHEVLEAGSGETSFLFGPRNIDQSESFERIEGYLPSRPSRVNKFVGRIDVLSKLLSWISSEDEPRKFLWGRGGCGKSTVAFEFASLVRAHGKSLQTADGNIFDRVIYLTAKEKELNTTAVKIQDTEFRDFSNFDELLKAILIASDYSEEEDYSPLSREELTARVKELFTYESILIVIDDIDTLTTKGEDAGFDRLFRLSLQSSNTVRLLYTQRNQPISSENAIEVTGFQREENYREFVESCCAQFKVPLPDEKYFKNGLKTSTECIPLIIETIVGLRKTCGSYEKANQIFLERRGAEARRYLFEREYEALHRDNNARHVLATIAEFGRPASNDEIGAIIRIGGDLISESIGEVIDFFLSTTISEEGETKYFVNPVTRNFLKDKTNRLDFGAAIVEAVRSFRTSGRKKPNEVVILESKVDRALSRSDLAEAKSLVSGSFPPKVSENASFRMLRARVFAKCFPQLVAEARDDFRFCIDHGHENAAGMRDWFTLERKSTSLKTQEEICNFVISGKGYADTVKHEFIARKATVQYFLGKDMGPGSTDALPLLSEALKLHTQAYNFFYAQGAQTIENFRYVRSTAFSFLNLSISLNMEKEFLRVIKSIQKQEGFLPEPLLDPLVEFSEFVHQGLVGKGDIARRREGLFRSIKSDAASGSLRFERKELSRKFEAKILRLSS